MPLFIFWFTIYNQTYFGCILSNVPFARLVRLLMMAHTHTHTHTHTHKRSAHIWLDLIRFPSHTIFAVFLAKFVICLHLHMLKWCNFNHPVLSVFMLLYVCVCLCVCICRCYSFSFSTFLAYPVGTLYLSTNSNFITITDYQLLAKSWQPTFVFPSLIHAEIEGLHTTLPLPYHLPPYRFVLIPHIRCCALSVTHKKPSAGKVFLSCV